jgi:hypothetical protein
MLSQSAVIVPERDDRGRGSACAKAAAARTSRGAGTSVTARIPSAAVCSASGRRRSDRPADAREQRPRRSTPKHNVRAGSVPSLCRNQHRPRRMRRRVVTQQKLFRRRPAAVGQVAMNRP